MNGIHSMKILLLSDIKNNLNRYTVCSITYNFSLIHTYKLGLNIVIIAVEIVLK